VVLAVLALLLSLFLRQQ